MGFRCPLTYQGSTTTISELLRFLNYQPPKYAYQLSSVFSKILNFFLTFAGNSEISYYSSPNSSLSLSFLSLGNIAKSSLDRSLS